MFDDYLNSDELRSLTRVGSSALQEKELQKLGVPYALALNGTPLVRRADLDVFVRTNPKPLFDKLRLDFGYPSKK
jgi:hypothetical protein